MPQVEEVSREVERERSSVSFAPKDAQLIVRESSRCGLVYQLQLISPLYVFLKTSLGVFNSGCADWFIKSS